MRKIGCLLILIFAVTAAYSQTLDSAIGGAAAQISEKLPARSNVAFVNFQSDSERLTNYVIDELNGKIANIGEIRAIERRQLSMVRDELDLNLSEYVSDESAQRIGKELGAQYVIMGSIDTIGDQYNVRFRTITTETMSIEVSFSQNVRNDTTLEALLSGTSVLADFSKEDRLKASALNLFFGAGSFAIQKDYFGGGITAAAEGLGVGLIVYAAAMYNAFSADYAKNGYTSLITTDMAYPLFTGIGLYVGGAIFGIVRAHMYHKQGSYIAASPLDGLQLNLVSHKNKNTGLQIAYKWDY